MMTGMLSAVSGLRAHQEKMDIIGNNIANVNTIAFKGSRVSFQEVFSQTIKGAGAADTDTGRGGSNPMQVGLGLSISAIDTVQTRGSMQRTDNNTDLAINGDGFFVVKDGKGGAFNFTRAGNFNVDKVGNMVSADGLNVYGWMETKPAKPGEFDQEKDVVPINVFSGKQTVPAKETTIAKFEGNLNAANVTLDKVDVPTNPVYSSANFPGITPAEYEVDTSTPPKTLPFGAVGGTNLTVPVSIAKICDLKNSKADSFTVPFTQYDKLGNATTVNITFIKNKTNDATATTPVNTEWFWYALTADQQKGVDNAVYNLSGPTEKKLPEANIDPRDTGNFLVPTQGYVRFDSTGAILNVEPINGSMDPVNKFSPLINSPSNEGTEQVITAVNFASITQSTGDSSVKATEVNGCPAGRLIAFAIGADGVITGTYSNGQQQALAQMALAYFDNPSGLEKVGGNLFAASSNSGDFKKAWKPGQEGVGTLNPGMLEMSNVDLSKEFIEMITTQRGFQANSKIISTTDEMLQDLVNLKR